MPDELTNLEKVQKILDDEYRRLDRIKTHSTISTYGEKQLLVVAQRYIELEQAKIAEINGATLLGIMANLRKLANATAGYKP